MARTKALAGEVLAPETEHERQLQAGREMAQYPELYDTPEDDPDPDDVALQNVIAELGNDSGDCVVNVYQLDDKKNRAFVGSFGPSEFSIGLIQAQFGAGEYRVEVRQNKKWLKKSTVRIAAPKINPLQQMQQMNVPQPAVETGKIIETMQAGFAQMGQMFAQALGSLAQKQPAPKSTLETLQEMQLMKQIFSDSAPRVDPMENFRLAMDLAEKIHPREGEPGTGEIIMNALEKFAPVISQIAERQPVIQPTTQSFTAPASIPPVPAIPATPPESEMNVMQKIYIKTLIGAASNGGDPYVYGNNVLDLMPEETVLQFLGPADWFDKAAQHVPEIAPHREWFESLKAAILELTTPESAATVQAGTEIASDENATERKPD